MFAKVKNTYTVKNYSRLYPYVHPYLFRVILALVLTLPLGAMDAVIAWVLKPYMDVVMIEKKAQAASLFPLLIIVFSFCQSALNYGTMTFFSSSSSLSASASPSAILLVSFLLTVVI